MALTDNLVSYWNLDESSGNAIDAHDSNDGTVTGATQGASGLINDAYSFGGAGDYIAIGNPANLQLTSAMSVSLWCNTSSNTRSIITKGLSRGNADERDWDIFGNGTNLIFVISNGSTYFVNAAAAWPDMSSGFHHIVCTWSGSAAAVYVDGSPFATDATGSGTPTTANILYLGGKHSSQPYEFLGTLDEVGIWSRELTSGEVTSLYNSGAGLAYPFSAGTKIPIFMYHYMHHCKLTPLAIPYMWSKQGNVTRREFLRNTAACIGAI